MNKVITMGLANGHPNMNDKLYYIDIVKMCEQYHISYIQNKKKKMKVLIITNGIWFQNTKIFTSIKSFSRHMTFFNCLSTHKGTCWSNPWNTKILNSYLFSNIKLYISICVRLCLKIKKQFWKFFGNSKQHASWQNLQYLLQYISNKWNSSSVP